MPTGSIRLSKHTRSEIGRAKAYARHHGSNSKLAEDAARRATVGRIADYIRAITAKAPQLTDEDLATLQQVITDATRAGGDHA